MKTKYLEERLGDIYFEFGTHADGRVDISSGRDETVATVSKEQAAKLIADRHELLRVICRLATNLHENAPAAYDQFYTDLCDGEFEK